MSLFTALSVSATGLTAQRQRAELLVENLANSETTRTAEGGPYRRKDAVFSTSSVDTPFQSVYAAELGNQSSGVEVSEIIVDSRDPVRRYLPGHPDADKDGYVQLPNVNPAEDMVDLMSASRNYQANVTAMSAVKDMIHRSIDLLR
ncbi:flagellar basal body rod protein FlgC [uncultured Paludibaculum sp.]|uniref:flagellar basal body rod protein FlgC n=1 Tax=uncultured Paludibaculum sp. TaxID=1765020 RepID=UPI002AAC207A|nr:flagellar basal body rod protein FlgC [uncultured Paludibaculum sp.]